VKYLKIILPVIALLLLVSGIILAPRYIKVSSIECTSQFGPCVLLEETLSSISGKSLYQTKKEIASVLSAESSVSDYSIRYKIPGNLSVYVVEKKPKFALSNSSFFALVDKDGTVLKIGEETTLPRVEITGNLPNVGEKVSEDYLFCLNLLYNLFANYQVERGVIEGEKLLVDITGIRVIFPVSGDKDVLLGSLRLIIERLKQEPKDSKISKGITQIDLRFKNPVLK
jgi:hypothetical protein